jgi:hypothetical protein
VRCPRSSGAPDQTEREALEVVVLDELVKVEREALEGDAEVVAKVEVVQSVDDVVLSVRVVVPEVLQDLDLDEGLVVEALLVADDLASADGVRLAGHTARLEQPAGNWQQYERLKTEMRYCLVHNGSSRSVICSYERRVKEVRTL